MSQSQGDAINQGTRSINGSAAAANKLVNSGIGASFTVGYKATETAETESYAMPAPGFTKTPTAESDSWVHNP